MLDYRKGTQVFQKLKVQNVPMVLRFPPTEGPLAINKPFDLYEVSKNGFSADKFAESVNKIYNVSVHVQRPVDYTKYVLFGTVALIGLAAVRFAYTYAFSLISKKTPWEFLVLVLLFDV
jgi:oligosaccharyltransferase complex subunit gamma